jgi:8-oxo-dGTP pyrophosphatase MutT (NUDIX family)
MDAKWSVREYREIVKDRWIDLRAETCQTPEGHEIDPYYVLSYPDWVNIVAITVDQHLVLTRQYRHAAGREFIELPGGAVEALDRDPETAARRELLEETGYSAPRFQLVATRFPNPALQTNRLHTYLALDAVQTVSPLLEPGEEGMAVQLVSLFDDLESIVDGLLEQALHVSSLHSALIATGHLKIVSRDRLR